MGFIEIAIVIEIKSPSVIVIDFDIDLECPKYAIAFLERPFPNAITLQKPLQCGNTNGPAAVLLDLAQFAMPGALIAVAFRVAAHIGHIGRIQIGFETDLSVPALELHDIEGILWILDVETLASTDGAGHGASYESVSGWCLTTPDRG